MIAEQCDLLTFLETSLKGSFHTWGPNSLNRIRLGCFPQVSSLTRATQQETVKFKLFKILPVSWAYLMSASLLGSQWRKFHHRLLAVIFICCVPWKQLHCFSELLRQWCGQQIIVIYFYKELRSLNTDLNQGKDMLFPTSTQYSEGVNILVQHHRRFWWLWCNLQRYNIFSFHIMQILLMKNTHTHLYSQSIM